MEEHDETRGLGTSPQADGDSTPVGEETKTPEPTAPEGDEKD